MIVTGVSLSLNTFAISSTEDNSHSSNAGSGSLGPSNPDSPWKLGATNKSDIIGTALPLETGTFNPNNAQILKALYVTLASV